MLSQNLRLIHSIPPFPGIEVLPIQLIPEGDMNSPLIQLGFPLDSGNIPILLRNAARAGCLRKDGKYVNLFDTVDALVDFYATKFDLELELCCVRGQRPPGSPPAYTMESSTWLIAVWSNYDSAGRGFGYPEHLDDQIMDLSRAIYGDGENHVPDWYIGYDWVPGQLLNEVCSVVVFHVSSNH